MCRISQKQCEYWSIIPEDRATAPLKSLQSVNQNYVSDTFGHVIPIEDYAKGQREVKPIDLGAIKDGIPVTLIIATEDTLCTA